MRNPESVILFNELSELERVASRLILLAGNERVWLFEGGMGAGKTTLIKKLCEKLGVISTVQSPTFSIVNEYSTEKGESIYHFDFYRLKDELEALDIGVEEYIDSGRYCFMEWPDKIESLWPGNYFLVKLEVDLEGNRVVRAALEN
jgi:tRNA threonylcarbamoyladenosine biosynthesis protein TsaE